MDESQIGPASVDLTLGNEFRVFQKHGDVYHIKDDSHFQDVTETVYKNDDEFITINPGEMILWSYKEKITPWKIFADGCRAGVVLRDSVWRFM